MALGRPVPSCAIRMIVGYGKGKALKGSPLRRTINDRQATAAILAATSTYFHGYTATPTRGVFQREGEPSLAVDLYRTQYDGSCAAMMRDARCLAADLRSTMRQHSVLLVAFDPSNRHAPISADLVTKGARSKCILPRSKKARAAAARAARDAI